MPDCFEGYQELLETKETEARNYELGTPNWFRGRVLHCASEDLKIAIDQVTQIAGEYTTDAERLQYLTTRKAVHHFDACFSLIRNSLYNPVHGQLRFLLETYLLLRALNKNRDRASDIWKELRVQLSSMYISREELPIMDYDLIRGMRFVTIDAFQDLIKEERDSLTKVEEDLLWMHPSISSIHPYSLEGVEIDNEYNEEIEGNFIDMVNAFAFGVASQFIKTWEGTPVYWDAVELLDPLIVRVRLATDGAPPALFDEDLDRWYASVGLAELYLRNQ